MSVGWNPERVEKGSPPHTYFFLKARSGAGITKKIEKDRDSSPRSRLLTLEISGAGLSLASSHCQSLVRTHISGPTVERSVFGPECGVQNRERQCKKPSSPLLTLNFY